MKMSLRRFVLKFAPQSQSCSYALLTSNWKQSSYSPRCLRTFHISCQHNVFKPRNSSHVEFSCVDIINQVIPAHKLESSESVSVDDWRSNRSSYEDAKVLRSILVELGRRKLYQAGKSYIEMIKKFEPHLLSPFNEIYIMRFLIHCEQGFSYFTNEEDIRYIEDTYTKIRSAFPVLDYYSAETLLLAMQKTSKWRVALDLLDDLSILQKPQATVYSAIICNALRENDIKLAWSTIDTMKEMYMCPHDECWIQWLQLCRRSGILEWKDSVGRMLEEFYSNHIQMSCAVANELANFIDELLPNYSVEQSSIFHGRCIKCSATLTTEFSKADHADLKEMVEKIITHESLYASTTPVEMQKFRNFIENCSPYDVVIDGLNALYSRRGFTADDYAKLKHDLNVRLLFLGRVHLAYNKELMDISKISQVFLCENLSRDDVFVLYSAIYHRPDVKFISDDKMRSQIYCLKDDKRRNLFRRWQHFNQVILKRYVKFPTYLSEIHKSENGTYHIPCVAESSSDLTWTPAEAQYWLCVRPEPKKKSGKRSTNAKRILYEPDLKVQVNADGTNIIDDLIKRLEESERIPARGLTQSSDKNVEVNLKRADQVAGIIKSFEKKYKIKNRLKPEKTTWLSDSLSKGEIDDKEVVTNVKMRFKQMHESSGKEKSNQDSPTDENER